MPWVVAMPTGSLHPARHGLPSPDFHLLGILFITTWKKVAVCNQCLGKEQPTVLRTEYREYGRKWRQTRAPQTLEEGPSTEVLGFLIGPLLSSLSTMAILCERVPTQSIHCSFPSHNGIVLSGKISVIPNFSPIFFSLTLNSWRLVSVHSRKWSRPFRLKTELAKEHRAQIARDSLGPLMLLVALACFNWFLKAIIVQDAHGSHTCSLCRAAQNPPCAALPSLRQVVLVLGYKSILDLFTAWWFPEDPAVTHMFCLSSALEFLWSDGFPASYRAFSGMTSMSQHFDPHLTHIWLLFLCDQTCFRWCSFLHSYTH